MKSLLVIALVAAVRAESDPGFVYTVGTHHAAPVTYTHAAPVVYTHPTVYASNACHNEAGALVPCAHGVAPGSAVYAFNHHGAAVVPAAAAPVEAKMDAEMPAEEGVVSVEKRDAEAEADPYLLYNAYYGYHHPYAYSNYYGYYGHPYYAGYYAHGCRNNMGALVPCA